MRLGFLIYALFLLSIFYPWTTIQFGQSNPPSKKTKNDKITFTQNIAGKGSDNQEISLLKGEVIFDIYYLGSGEFAAWLTSTDRNYIQPLIINKGRFSRKNSVTLPFSGSYKIEIVTSGDWAISIQGRKFRRL
jgi:hypothetical protein